MNVRNPNNKEQKQKETKKRVKERDPIAILINN